MHAGTHLSMLQLPQPYSSCPLFILLLYVSVCLMPAYIPQPVCHHPSPAALFLPNHHHHNSYHNPHPMAEDYAKEPPVMPPHLQLTLLNVPSTAESTTSLPRPQHVILNHIYVQRGQVRFCLSVWSATFVCTHTAQRACMYAVQACVASASHAYTLTHTHNHTQLLCD